MRGQRKRRARSLSATAWELGVTTEDLRAEIARSELLAVRVNGKLRILQEDLDDYLERHRVVPEGGMSNTHTLRRSYHV